MSWRRSTATKGDCLCRGLLRHFSCGSDQIGPMCSNRAPLRPSVSHHAHCKQVVSFHVSLCSSSAAHMLCTAAVIMHNAVTVRTQSAGSLRYINAGQAQAGRARDVTCCSLTPSWWCPRRAFLSVFDISFHLDKRQSRLL